MIIPANDSFEEGVGSMRVFFVSTVVMMTVSLTVQLADAQSREKPKAGGEPHILAASDGWPIHVTYFPSGSGSKESPVVILVAGAEGREQSKTRKVWDPLALELQKAGYAAITVDLRKHGDSVPEANVIPESRLNRLVPDDYKAMAFLDLEAVKAFLVEQHELESLNIRKLGIISSGSSCLIGAAFAVADWNKKPWPDAATLAARTPRGQDVRAVVMFSPKSPVRGFSTPSVMKLFADPAKGIAAQVFHSTADKTEQRAAEQVFRYLKIDGEEYKDVRQIVPAAESQKVSGEEFLTGPLGDEVRKSFLRPFLQKNLEELDSPWKSRKSRL